MKTTLIHNWCIGSGSHTNCFMTLLVTIFSVYNLHKYKITKILRKSEWNVFESIGYFARMRSKACLNYLQCSNTKMWCSACHMTATATSHGRVVCGRCLDPAAPATIAPWSTLIRIPSCRPEPRVIFIPSPSADTSWLKVSTKFRGDFHNIPLDIGMQYLCLFISWVYILFWILWKFV